MQRERNKKYNLDALTDGILSGKNQWLSKGITLVESLLTEDRKESSNLMERLLPSSGKSLRIGITGVPGVGKSTFIEAFGSHLTKLGKKLAVLSIDPSSSISKGSILGDKTRMAQLSMDSNAFIRPSPAGSSLGGVATSTRESIILCEAAGYDVIIVETVGVGQSETIVKNMVDFFLLLMLPGSGDELQGIKRGIMEMADGIFINKSDGNMERAKRARKDFQNALHLFPPAASGWTVPVELGSSLEKDGIGEILEICEKFNTQTSESGWFEENRKNQEIKWFHQLIGQRLEADFYSYSITKEKIKKAEEMISSAQTSVRKALDDLFFA
ncbi:MAG: methylmalonyl Co-A mutase-associated GTPase MeaB [Cytophagales bacterium]|nr:methylmalonyl Co-A mutase-associated GTPase MeaB [Cytophagales bacterium]